MLVFAILGALDRIFGNRFGLGKEFERGFMLLGPMFLSMIGMIVISPLIADLLEPCFDWVYKALHIDPSVIPAMLFANDMGGAPLSTSIAKEVEIGRYNALVISSMMGVTVSFTIPYALGIVRKEHHRQLFLGFLCGFATIPVGAFIVGLFLPISFSALLINLLPLLVFAAIVIVGLLLRPELTIKIFSVIGVAIKILITVGLVIGMVNFVTGKEIVKGVATFGEGVDICVNAAIFLAGAFPLLYIVSKLLEKPMGKAGKLIGVNAKSMVSLIACLATNATTFEMMNEDMDKKGQILNAAFAVSGAFVFGSHLAFTMAFDDSYIVPVIAAKLISGFASIPLAAFLYKRTNKEKVE